MKTSQTHFPQISSRAKPFWQVNGHPKFAIVSIPSFLRFFDHQALYGAETRTIDRYRPPRHFAVRILGARAAKNFEHQNVFECIFEHVCDRKSAAGAERKKLQLTTTKATLPH